MSSIFRSSKLTAVPSLPCNPNEVFIIAPPGTTEYFEIYVSNSAGSSLRRLLTNADIQELIDSSIADIGGETLVVDNIAARNALTLTKNTQVLVLDATGDSTVASGAATYIYRVSNTSFYKISEAESFDVVLQWANIQGRPVSSTTAIDTAVTNSHTHTNKSQLDKIGQNTDGFLTYNNALPVIGWEEVQW